MFKHDPGSVGSDKTLSAAVIQVCVAVIQVSIHSNRSEREMNITVLVDGYKKSFKKKNPANIMW